MYPVDMVYNPKIIKSLGFLFMDTKKDEQWMKTALNLAERGGIKVRPNPMVGAVVVKNNRITGSGYHKQYGGAHAEIGALQAAGNMASNASLYVTLEPCDHTGKTPPCTDAIISSGIKRVIIAMKDPNPLVSGAGIKKLKSSGIAVTVGLLENDARSINKVYIKNVRTHEPFVILKMAQTLDGKTASRSRDSKWISNSVSRRLVHAWRSESEAVLVGSHTAQIDDPTLTSHGKGRNPLRIIIDQHNSLDRSLNIFNNKSKTLIISQNTSPFKLNFKQGRFNLKYIMKELFKIGIYQLLIEGGGTLNSFALEDDIVDEIRFFISPKIVGGKDALTAVEGHGISKIKQAVPVKNWSYEPVAGDLLIKGSIH